MSGIAEQTTSVEFPSVSGVILENPALDLGDGFKEDTDREERDGDVEQVLGPGRVDGCEAECQGVQAVIDGVEDAD